jgi:aspartate racemase
MQTIGLVGGMSWHSTLEYYRIINQRVADRLGGHASAPIVVWSLDFAEVRDHQISGDWAAAAALLADAAERCQTGGADVVALCTNLMHRVAPEVQQRLDVPLLHIADAVAGDAVSRGWTRLGVLGARAVMEESFYADRLARHGLSTVAPAEHDRDLVDRVIFAELTQGRLDAGSRAAYVEVIGRLADQGAEAVVLACTEIGLLVGAKDSPLPMIDSASSHAGALAAACLGA